MTYQTQSNPNNRGMPKSAGVGVQLEKWLGAPFRLLEQILYYVMVLPLRIIMRPLDKLSYKLEGTLLKTIVQYTLFPVTIVATLIIGFAVVDENTSLQNLAVLAALPLVYGLIFGPLERLFPFSRKWLEDENGPSVDIMMYVSGAVWTTISKFLLVALSITAVVEMIEPYGHAFWPSELPGWAQVMLFLLAKDFFRYWYHRWLHEVPFLWRWHAVHHSVERLYWLNGIRSHPIEIIGQALFYAIPTALFQPEPHIVFISVLMALSIGIFQHANLDLKLRFWEYIFSIGDNHRYHHYPIKGIGDSNYGGEFIVWDILFGTFHNPKNERPSDNIGIGTAPNYPLTWAGLMIAPFLPNQKEAFGPSEEAQEQPEVEAASTAPAE